MVWAVPDELFELFIRVKNVVHTIFIIQLHLRKLSCSQLILLEDGAWNQNVIVSLGADHALHVSTMVLGKQEPVEIVLVLFHIILLREVCRHVEVNDACSPILHRVGAARLILRHLDLNRAKGRLHSRIVDWHVRTDL